MRERDEKNAHKIRETYLMNSRVKNTKHKCLRSVDELLKRRHKSVEFVLTDILEKTNVETIH